MRGGFWLWDWNTCYRCWSAWSRVEYSLFTFSILLTSCRHVTGFDIDPDALQIAQENNEHFETSVDFIRTNLDQNIPLRSTQDRPFDVIVMNPPFGTKKNVGIDSRFVQLALQYAPIVYSLHKTSTRKVSLITSLEAVVMSVCSFSKRTITPGVVQTWK